MVSKPSVMVDFDGTLHSYVSGWQGAGTVSDPPVRGAKEAVEYLRRRYRVFVVSSRCAQKGGVEAIQRWLQHYSITVDGVQAEKPDGCVLNIDDRGVRFEGDWDAVLRRLNELEVPWYDRRRS